MFCRSFSSEDSELSESVVNLKSAIRVSVCLQRYFKDVRARCYLLVARNRRVRWLEKRIQKIFALPGTFCLCSDGHLLPSTEPLALLRPEDTIEVIPLLETNTDTSHKTNSLVLNVNKQIENDTHKEDTVSESTRILYKSASKHHLIFIDETDCNETATPAEDVNRSKLQNYDEIDSTRTLYSTSSPDNSSFAIKNNNYSTSPGDMNGHYKPKEESNTLQQFKRRALALLDAQCGAQGAVDAEVPPPRRARKRVRRRTRRVQPEPEPASELEPETEPYQQPVLELEPESNLTTSTHSQSESDLPATVPPTAATPVDSRVAAASPQPQQVMQEVVQEVTRNESACSRRPRVVKSLDVEN